MAGIFRSEAVDHAASTFLGPILLTKPRFFYWQLGLVVILLLAFLIVTLSATSSDESSMTGFFQSDPDVLYVTAPEDGDVLVSNSLVGSAHHRGDILMAVSRSQKVAVFPGQLPFGPVGSDLTERTYSIRMPIDGFVRPVTEAAAQMHVAKGERLLAVSSSANGLVGEALIDAADVLAMHLGMPVTLHVSGTPFVEEDMIHGDVSKISDTPEYPLERTGMDHADNNPYYKIQIRIYSNSVNARRFRGIRPGMLFHILNFKSETHSSYFK